MSKILNTQQAIRESKQRRAQGKTIVLAGGCFDILHVGHIAFLEEAKRQGHVLFILLESDETVGRLKGDDRPINTQHDRARILSALSSIDYVVLLPPLGKDEAYDEVVTKIAPSVIAITKNDPGRSHKQRQGKLVNARVVEVVERLSNTSSSCLAKILAG